MVDAQQAYLYPDHNVNECGGLTAACEQFFFKQGCFYECDKNLGKWRKHDVCSADDANDNGWEVEGVPIKAAYCDAWYQACSGPNNKLCIGAASEAGSPVYPYFGQPTCHLVEGAAGCRRIDEVYTSGRHICETMWGGSFKYENDISADAYVMSFTEGATNPNNAMFSSKAYPKRCAGDIGAVNLTKAELEGCTANWYVSADSYTEQHTMNSLQCDDGNCFSTSGGHSASPPSNSSTPALSTNPPPSNSSTRAPSTNPPPSTNATPPPPRDFVFDDDSGAQWRRLGVLFATVAAATATVEIAAATR